MPTKAITAAVAAAALVIVSVPASAGAAATKTRTAEVPGTVVFMNGQRQDKPGSCSAVVFAQWKDVPGTVKATVHYTYRGAEHTKTLAAPFNDRYQRMVTYEVPAGNHWIQLGQSWRNGHTPSTCGDYTEKQKAVYNTAARVTLTIDEDAKPELKLTLKPKASKTDGVTTLRVTARNTGRSTLESVRIHDKPSFTIRNRAKGCSGSILKQVARPAAPGTLAPGEAKASDFVFTHGCAGTVGVEVSADGIGGGTPVSARAKTTVTVKSTAWIVGEIRPVELWPGVFAAPAEIERYVRRIASPVSIRADGKYTGRAKVTQGPTGPVARYSIKIAGDDVGRTRLEPLAPRGWKTKPRIESVNLRPGERRVVNFGVAYDCDAPAPGLDFVPHEGLYNATGTPLAVSYRCASRAVRVGALLTAQPNYDAERGILGCKRANGEPYPARVTDHVVWSLPTLLESKGRFGTKRYALGEFETVTFAGEFSRADVAGASLHHRECGVGLNAKKLEFAGSTVYSGP